MYHPYAGGVRFPYKEKIFENPGAKVWVDGGRIDYDQEICFTKQLDCYETCCVQRYCAPVLSDCFVYQRKPYSDLYIGVFVILMIYVGIPSCIIFVEFTLTYKFCRRFDEDLGAYLDGMTICESITYILTCGKSSIIPKHSLDDYDYKFEEPTEE